jgi:voltage-gated potassium channel
MVFWFLPQRIRAMLARHKPIVWLATLFYIYAVLCAVNVVGMMVVEEYTLIDAVWLTWQTSTTVGFGDVPPKTAFARLITMGLMTCAIAVLPLTFATVVELIMYRKDLRRFGAMKSPYTGGYVLMNYPRDKKFKFFVEQIRILEDDVPITVVDSALKEIPEEIAAAYPKLHFVKGSLLEVAVYEKARLREAKAIVVYPPQQATIESDATTAAIVRLVAAHIIGADPAPTLQHLQLDPSNDGLFGDLPSTAIFGGFSTLAMVQQCQDPGTATFLTDILRNDVGANIFSVVPARSIGLPWREFVGKAMVAADGYGNACMPVAIVRGKKALSCPINETIKAGDRLILTADNGFDWLEYEEKMHTARK